MSGQTRDNIGTIQVEVVPPGMDTTVDTDGTDFDWDTTIRFPRSQGTLTIVDGETYTVEADTTDEFETVIVESGGTLTINGTLIIYETFTVNGTVNHTGTVTNLGSGNITGASTFLGADSKRPTEVELRDGVGSKTTYEMHGYSIETGSNMIQARLIEQ